MDQEKHTPLNPHDIAYDKGDLFYVRIGKTGPRGGKRPPLWEGYVRTYVADYNDALESAQQELLRTCRDEIRCG